MVWKVKSVQKSRKPAFFLISGKRLWLQQTSGCIEVCGKAALGCDVTTWTCLETLQKNASQTLNFKQS